MSTKVYGSIVGTSTPHTILAVGLDWEFSFGQHLGMTKIVILNFRIGVEMQKL